MELYPGFTAFFTNFDSLCSFFGFTHFYFVSTHLPFDLFLCDFAVKKKNIYYLELSFLDSLGFVIVLLCNIIKKM